MNTKNLRNDAILAINLTYDTKIRELKISLDKVNQIIAESAAKSEKDKTKLTEKQLKQKMEMAAKYQRLIDDAEIKRYALLLNQKHKLDAQAFEKKKQTAKKNEKEIADEAAKQQKQGITGYVGRWQRAFDTVTRYFTAYQVFNLVIGAVKDVGKEYLEVEKTLYRVQAITGDNAAETAKLRDTVFEIGAGFNISATEVANFVFEMAKLGKTGEEIQFIAKGAAALSVVLGEDMVSSGKLIGTTLNQFNLVGSEANKVAGVFLNTIKNSPQNLKDLQIELQYLGSIANASSFEINELGVMIEFMSNKGIAASKIGTGMRNMLLEIAKMGGTAKDAMEELSKSGINLAEAEEKFGKRGALVAYELIRNWDEVKDMFETSVPTAIELTVTAMQGNQGIINEFTSTWKRFKAAIIGGELVDDEIKYTDQFVKSLEDFGVGIDDAMKRIKDAVEKGEEIDWQKLFPEEKEYSLGTAKLAGFQSSFIEAGKYVEEQYKSQSFQEKQTERILENSKKAAAEINKQYKAQLITSAEAEAEILKLQTKLKRDLDSIFFIGSDEKSQKVASEYRATQVATHLDYTLEQYKDQLKQFDEDIARALKNPNATEAYNEVTKVGEKRDELCKILKALGYPCPEDIKKGKKAALDYLRTQRAEFKDEMERAFVEADAFAQETRGSDKNIKELTSFEMKDLVSPSDLLLEYFENDKKAILADNSGSEAYTTYLTDKLTQIKKDLEETKDKELSVLDTEFNTKSDALSTRIATLIGLRNGELDQKVKEDIDLEIADLMKSLTVLNTVYRKDVDDVIKSASKANHDIDAKGISLTNTLEKLLFGMKGDVDKDEAARLKAVFKRNSDYMKAMQNYLSDVVDIYKTFSEEMYNQQQDRLDAQKKSLELHYDFEQEILRSSVDNQLITQEDYQNRLNELNKKKVKKENELAKASFDAQKKRDRNAAITDGIVQGGQAFIQGWNQGGGNPVLGAILGAIGAAVVVAQTAIKLNGIAKRQFTPVQYADGGIVDGASHANGGVPFNVRGSGGYEMEGGEYIIKKSSVNRQTLPLLDAINNDKRYDPTYFANGGVVSAPTQPQTPSVIRALITEKDLDAYFKNKDFNDSRKKLFG